MSKGKAAKACSCVLVYEYSCDYSYIYPGTAYTQQSYKVSDTFPYKWINKKWRDCFYVTSMATAGSRWAVVMSRNAGFSDQVAFFPLHQSLLSIYFYTQVKCDIFLIELLPFTFQVVELDFLYPSEGIHKRWDSGYRITATAGTWDQAAFVLSVPRRRPTDETQETLRTTAFPSQHVKVNKPAAPHSVSYRN